MSICELLDITCGSVLAVVGCGGKTSIIRLIADKNTDRKVLISPTTKILPMTDDDADDGVISRGTVCQCEAHIPQTGLQCLGVYNDETGKLEALPGHILAKLVPRYDVSLLEADGSQGLPCKGWRCYEPVVPEYCTHTVGIVTMRALGAKVSGATVHRIPEFSSLTGLHEGDFIDMQALVIMVCSPQGMFKNSVGRRYLIVNQVEDDPSADAARAFLREVRNKDEKHFDSYFEKLLYGSVFTDTWQEG